MWQERGSISGSRRFPWEGHGDPLQYSLPGKLVDRGAWQWPRPWGHKELVIPEIKELFTAGEGRVVGFVGRAGMPQPSWKPTLLAGVPGVT